MYHNSEICTLQKLYKKSEEIGGGGGVGVKLVFSTSLQKLWAVIIMIATCSSIYLKKL